MNKECFTCGDCGTLNCPNNAIDAYDDRFGYPAAEDMGYRKISCNECHHNTGQCEDCLFHDSEYCEKQKGAG